MWHGGCNHKQAEPPLLLCLAVHSVATRHFVTGQGVRKRVTVTVDMCW